MNKAIVQYDEFLLSVAQLQSLPEDQVAALATLSYAVTEVNCLARIFLSQSHDYIGEKLIDELVGVQRLVILRTWSAKLFEVIEFLQGFSSKKSQLTDDPLIVKLAQEALVELAPLTKSEGYEAARDLRHEATNHYSFKAAKGNIRHVHSDALCSLYIHRHGGNDFFPLGEAVMFHGRLHRRWKDLQSLDRKREKFDSWLQWCMDANKFLIELHAKFANAIVFKGLGRNTFYQRNYFVPESMVGHPFDDLTPIVFRENVTP
jgi:hypothetical protein